MAIRLYGTRQCPQLTQTTAGEPASHGRHTTRASPISSLPNPLARCAQRPNGAAKSISPSPNTQTLGGSRSSWRAHHDAVQQYKRGGGQAAMAAREEP